MNHSLNDTVEITWSVVDADDMFSRDQQVIFYRIIQEALTNIAKHAAATRVSVVLEQNGSSLVCVVEDNGKGFDVNDTLNCSLGTRGFGLSIIAERARMLGGSVTIRSQKDEGARLTVTVPLDSDQLEFRRLPQSQEA
jgi:signal transduction histidine kinase